MPRSITAEPAVAAFLAAVPEVAAGGGRVFPWKKAPQLGPWPYLSYHRVRLKRWKSTKGYTSAVAVLTLQVDVWDDDYARGKRLADAAALALPALARTTYAGVAFQAATVDGPRDLGEDPPFGDEAPQYRFSLDCSLTFDEE